MSLFLLHLNIAEGYKKNFYQKSYYYRAWRPIRQARNFLSNELSNFS